MVGVRRGLTLAFLSKSEIAKGTITLSPHQSTEFRVLTAVIEADLCQLLFSEFI